MRYLAILLALAGLPAAAQDWTLLPDQSAISFTYTENDAPFPGAFTRLEGTAQFNEFRPQDTAVQVAVDVTSVRLGDFVRTAFAQTADWFDTARYPDAVFELDGITPLDQPGRWRADGVMTIKGQRHPVSTTFLLTRPGNCLRARGDLTMDLDELGIGQGRVSRFIRVGREIVLSFNLLGHPDGVAPDCSVAG